MTEQTPETTTAETPYEPQPSELLTPDQLDQALLVVVVRRDGTAVTFTSNDTDRNALAAWMHSTAETIRVAPEECEACRAGAEHTHHEDSRG